MCFEGLEDHLYGAPGRWSLRRCDDPACDRAWLDPAPAPVDLPLVYERYFTHAERERSRTLRLLDRLHSLLSILPARASGLARARRDIQSMFLAELPPGRLLDVGCGAGRFLAEMRRRGWQTQGIDVDAAAIEWAKSKHRLEVEVASLEEAAFAPHSFDAVTASHVIEHVEDPTAFVRECMRILRPGGRVVVTTPNLSALGFTTFGAAWAGLDPPRHLNLFTLESLRRCAEAAGAREPRVVSSAANAAVVFATSSSLDQRAKGVRPGSVAELTRRVRAVLFQYREQLGLPAHPEWGEEAVLRIEVGAGLREAE